MLDSRPIEIEKHGVAGDGGKKAEMGSGDFLRRRAQTPETAHYVMAGVLGAIATNSPEILKAARASFGAANSPLDAPKIHWRFWVNPQGTSEGPWPKPLFRGLGHLIFVGLDTENSILIDLRRRRAIGRLSPAMGNDGARWRNVIFPNLITLMGPAVGVTDLHCACVEREGKGILLGGPSGSGKSTLTLALIRRGFGFVSDDCTFCSECNGAIRAWGLVPRLKLLPAAAAFFPELANLETTVCENGEEALEIYPEPETAIRRNRSCEPQELVFLERAPGSGFALARMSGREAAARLEADFLPDSADGLRAQNDIVRQLVERRSWQLRYGEAPDTVAHKLAELFR